MVCAKGGAASHLAHSSSLREVLTLRHMLSSGAYVAALWFGKEGVVSWDQHMTPWIKVGFAVLSRVATSC